MTPTLQRRNEQVSLDDFEEMLLDRPEHEKWELIDGRIVKSMVGARWEHHVIISNLDFAIVNHLRARNMPCRTFRETFFLKRKEDELAALPDLMVHCGSLPAGGTSLDDPLILIEVVSPGSEGRDRLVKRIAYQRLPSLRHYVLIERDRIWIDHYVSSDGTWRGEPPLDTLGATLKLAAIDLELPVVEIYRDVARAD